MGSDLIETSLNLVTIGSSAFTSKFKNNLDKKRDEIANKHTGLARTSVLVLAETATYIYDTITSPVVNGAKLFKRIYNLITSNSKNKKTGKVRKYKRKNTRGCTFIKDSNYGYSNENRVKSMFNSENVAKDIEYELENNRASIKHEIESNGEDIKPEIESDDENVQYKIESDDENEQYDLIDGDVENDLVDGNDSKEIDERYSDDGLNDGNFKKRVDKLCQFKINYNSPFKKRKCIKRNGVLKKKNLNILKVVADNLDKVKDFDFVDV